MERRSIGIDVDTYDRLSSIAKATDRTMAGLLRYLMNKVAVEGRDIVFTDDTTLIKEEDDNISLFRPK